MAGDLADACGGFGGLYGQLNHLANVLDMAITDHPGIALTYDSRAHALIQNTALKRSSITDYFDLFSNVIDDVKAALGMDFESRYDATRKEKEKRMAEQEKRRTRIGRVRVMGRRRSRVRRRRRRRRKGNGLRKNGRPGIGRSIKRNRRRKRNRRPKPKRRGIKLLKNRSNSQGINGYQSVLSREERGSDSP